MESISPYEIVEWHGNNDYGHAMYYEYRLQYRRMTDWYAWYVDIPDVRTISTYEGEGEVIITSCEEAKARLIHELKTLIE